MADKLQMTAADITRFLEESFPQALNFGAEFSRVDTDGVTLTLATSERHLRPGGTVSGPTMMTLADTVAYFSILARVGPKAMAVTSSLEMHFLRRPSAGSLIAEGRILKLGRRVAVVQVELRVNEDPALVAVSTVTYALPG